MACEHEWSELDYPTPDDKVCLRCCERQRESALRTRVAELEAALREMVECGEGCPACGDGTQGGCGCRYERAREALGEDK